MFGGDISDDDFLDPPPYGGREVPNAKKNWKCGQKIKNTDKKLKMQTKNSNYGQKIKNTDKKLKMQTKN